MTDKSKEEALDAYIDAAAETINLPIPRSGKSLVREHLDVAARMAGLLTGFELDPREEPAPVFWPEPQS